MKPEHWQRINDVFASVLEREPAERPGFLASVCHGDAALQAEVKSLLASYEESGNFLETPAFEAEWSAESERIGPYLIQREIGRGGMSTVYLAVRDDQYQKQVAVKLIKRGMDTDYVVQRFLAERQILANLVHPNIAQLLVGGLTSEGLPYFVMEYVEGVAIDEYCDSQCLSITERLKLFSTVCSAVHYAHQNLVIHRDIKPSNILVTSEGVPKLLDFGIAKLLNPELSNWT
ncbi:MAG: serine/threonine protein kinase, partial [Gemmatimonadaceae bacterium]|nr:serine/threonine protein kinase [Gloeobacterales cyanobacterium ES-bin-141]